MELTRGEVEFRTAAPNINDTPDIDQQERIAA
jgi:hypothetical protein